MCCCRSFYRCKRVYEEPKESKTMIPKKMPWIWIGAEVDGVIVDVTEKVSLTTEKYITPGLLSEITNLRNVQKWLYIDAVSLTECQFPSDVFIIEEDDPIE